MKVRNPPGALWALASLLGLSGWGLPVPAAEACSAFVHHGLTPGMTQKEVWQRMDGKGLQREVVVQGRGQRSILRYERDGAVIDVEFDGVVARRGEARVVRVQSSFAERAAEQSAVLQSLIDSLGDPVEGSVEAIGSSPARWGDAHCGIEVVASRRVPEWWEPGRGPTVRVEWVPLSDGLRAAMPTPTPPEVPEVVPPVEVAVRNEPERVTPEATPTASPEPLQSIDAPTDPAGQVPPAVEIEQLAVDRGPVAIHSPPPIYPAAARRLNTGGRVVLSVLVDVSGAVDDVSLVSVEGSRRMADRALDAVREWRYQPAVKDGEAVSARTTVAVNF